MENTELELFNQIFNHEIKDDVMKFIPPTYETWINFKNQHTFYRGLIKPDKISPIDSWLDDRHINCDYKNYILKKDINFFKVFLTNNNILFDKARAIIILCLSIIDTEIFSPPIYYDNIISKTEERSGNCRTAIGIGSNTAITDPITGIKFNINVNVPKIKASSKPKNQYIRPAKTPVAVEVINFVKIYFLK